ncbi:MAG: response regulator transcription factor [Chloroflexi bacterium]|nr:response regulator transcription factor [Chloroflexota bacterium]
MSKQRETEGMIRVVLVDDHRLFREALQSYLEREPDIEVVEVFEDGPTLLQSLPQVQADVFLVDIKMTPLNGLETTRHILAQDPNARVIILTVSEADEDLLEAFKAGARGYLLKGTTSGHELAQAIRRVARGEAIIPPALAPRLLAEFASLARTRPPATSRSPEPAVGEPPEQEEVEGPRGDSDPALEMLTPRERQVLELVALGLTNREIAERLVISENTVRTHLRRILHKLHVRSRVEAAVWLREHVAQEE